MIVTTISFFVIRSAPGDPFSYESDVITPAIREHWREQFGYNRPLPVQFARYIVSVAHGELGYSFEMHEPVAAALGSAVPRTLLLTGLSLGLSFLFGIVIGVLQATHRDTWWDRVTSGVL